MTAPLRRSACPSLAFPMQTGDGLLARINTVTGSISPGELRRVAEAAARHGNGILEVTRRGSLQVRGLTIESAALFSEDVFASGIDIRTGVPVETGPLAGFDQGEVTESRSVSKQIIDKIDKSGFSERLGPKVSVVVDGGGSLSMNDVLADVRLVASSREPGLWVVSVGDTEADARLVARTDSDTAVALCLGLLDAIAEIGRSGRGRALPEAAISSACDTVGLRFEPNAELPGRRQAPSPRSPIGRFTLTENRYALGVGLPYGQASASQIHMLCQALKDAAVSEFRFAPDHALLAICNSDAIVSRVMSAAQEIGLITEQDDPRLRIVACAGAPACASATIATKAIAAEIASHGLLPADGQVHVSGCPKGCAEPASAAISIIGTQDGARILNGRAGQEFAHVAEREVAAAFQRVMRSRDMGRETSAAFAVPPRNSG